MHRLHRLRARRGVLITGVVVALLAFPLGVIASHQFTDVPNSNPYHADIDAVADAGVTTGCGGGNYCPGAFVTREQMAAFMNRLGALQAGKTPVTNAATSQSTDGWSLGCPTGTVLGGGLCFETAQRGTTNSVYTASETCAALGGGLLGRGQIWKLPDALELRAADQNGDISVTGDTWTASVFYDGAYQTFRYDGDGGIDPVPTVGTTRGYRCAALPMQRDLLVIVPLGAPQDGSDPKKVKDRGEPNEDGSFN
jgi:hypothetical protein